MTDLTKSSENLSGMYRGRVENSADPMDTGRIKVRVFGLYGDDVPESALPWAIPAAPITHDCRASGATGGEFRVPKEGQRVWVFFDHGDHMQPVYFAKAVSGPDWERNRSAVETFLNKIRNVIDGFLSLFTLKANLSIEDLPNNKDVSVSATEDGEVKITDHKNNRTILLTEEDFEYSTLKKTFVEGNYHEGVKGNKTADISGNEKKEIGSNKTEKVKGKKDQTALLTKEKAIMSYSLIAGTGVTLGSGGVFTITGQDITITGKTNTGISGKNVTISGTSITIQAPSITLHSTSTPLILKGPTETESVP